MTNEHNNPHGDARRDRKKTEDEKRFVTDDLQDLARFGGDFIKKTVASGFDAIKEVKGNIPKEAGQLLSWGKDELIKTLSQETVKNIISFTIDRFFVTLRSHQLEFSVRVRKRDGEEDAPSSHKLRIHGREKSLLKKRPHRS